MKPKTSLVQTKQFEEQSTLWLEAIGRQENVSVCFFPKTDRLRRLQQLLEDKEFLKKHLAGFHARFIFQLVDVGIHNIEEVNDLQQHISGHLNLSNLSHTKKTFDQWITYLKENNLHLVIILGEAERFIGRGGFSALGLFSHLTDKYYPFINLLGFYEADISHSSIRSVFPNRLYQNVFTYPLYPREDAARFIRYLAIKWNCGINPKIEEEIIKQCGGHFWLIKEAVRQIVAGKKNPFSGEGMQFRLQNIFSSLSVSEQSVFKKIALKSLKQFTEEEQESLSFLQKMNMIGEKNYFLISLFNQYILSLPKAPHELYLESDHLYLNSVPVDRFFSRKELRVMRLLVEKQGLIASRDEIADRIWPTKTSEHYSDWAIDQLIARIRRRLAEMSLHPEVLQVIRGRGYLLKKT